MKLTKLKALWLCHELWFWLYKNPDNEKYEWPKWIYNNGIYFDNSACECFACDYKQENDMDCHNGECIMINAWNYNKKSRSGKYPCERRYSPYSLWYVKDKAKNAKIISDSAYEEYVKIGGKRKKLGGK